MFIDTFRHSTAVDGIVLPLTSRRVQIGWQSGSVETLNIRRRDQLRFIALRALMTFNSEEEISYGGFANWCQENCEWQFV